MHFRKCSGLTYCLNSRCSAFYVHIVLVSLSEWFVFDTVVYYVRKSFRKLSFFVKALDILRHMHILYLSVFGMVCTRCYCIRFSCSAYFLLFLQKRDMYEGGLKSFRTSKDTRHFYRNFLKLFNIVSL